MLTHAQSLLAGKWEETSGSGLEIQLSLAVTEQALTGTFTVRVRLANPQGLLRPNQFVRARLKGATRPNAMVVPVIIPVVPILGD